MPDISLIDEEKRINKEKYLLTLSEGSLIAFYNHYKGKPETGKVVKKSTYDRLIKVITIYGAEFIVAFEDVLWIKTGSRWPKGIYNLLKGKENG